MATARAVSVVRSPRVLLGTSAVADLLTQAPEEVFTPVVSLAGGLSGSPAVGFVTTWVMFSIALYTFSPLADSQSTNLPRQARGFRLLVTLSVVTMGIGIQRFSQGPALAVLVVSGAFVAGGLLSWYLRVIQGWRLTDPDGRAVETLASVFPQTEVIDEFK